jgi:predicted MPP superfamily phosphohydrolase
MIGFWLILGGIVACNLGWWAWADRRLRPLPAAAVWRSALAVFIAAQLAYLAAFFLAPVWARQSHRDVPAAVLGVIYLWSLVVLPAAVVVTLLLGGGVSLVDRLSRRSRARERSEDQEHDARPADDRTDASAGPPAPFADSPAAASLSRRQLLAAAAVAVPPLVAAGGVAYGRRRSLYDLHVNRVDVPVPGLPDDLVGLTIAHVSDVHVGKFVREDYLRRAAEMANALRADLHLLTGDLIDLSIADLPMALDFVRRLQPEHALVTCEGNHDLIDDPRQFRTDVRAARIPLLVNEAVSVRVPGRPTPVRLLGLPWGPPGTRTPGEDQYQTTVAAVAAQRRDGEFPILLAHHPHAFDAAADADIPLTLAGHTHGGLLMLSETVGPGPLLYRYWRGLYQRRESALYVTTGVGSWFPLRTHARPEIAHLTLRRA